MKKQLLFLIVILFQVNSFSQAPAILWKRSFGGTGQDSPYCIQATSDGGYIVAGFTQSNNVNVTGNHGAFDWWLAKLNSNGILEWQKTLGGTDHDYAKSIQQTTDGGYIVAGASYSNNSDVSGNHGGKDFWVVKLDLNGLIIWQKMLGGSGNDDSFCVKMTNDGGYIVAGYTESSNGDITNNHGGQDYWVIKLNINGIIEWQKTYGSGGDDIAYQIQQTSDNGYIMTGFTRSGSGDVTGFHGDRDFWVVKVNSLGIIQWQKAIGGSSYEESYSIQQSLDGGFIVAGVSSSTDGDVTGNHGGNDFWVIKLNPSGQIEWQKSLGGTSGETAFSVTQTIDGGYILAGQTSSLNGDVSGNNGQVDYWIVKISSIGNIQWKRCMGGTTIDTATYIQQTNDGGYVICGQSNSLDGQVENNIGGYDFWVVKLAPDPLSNETFTQNHISISPNPTHSNLNLQFANNEPIDKIIITDVLGKKLLEKTQHTSQINVENLAKGTYIIQAYSGDKKLTSKFIKE